MRGGAHSCLPSAKALTKKAQSVNLISGPRKGKRCREEGESVGETAGASDNSGKHQPGLDLLGKCAVTRVVARICRSSSFLVFINFSNLLEPQGPELDY